MPTHRFRDQLEVCRIPQPPVAMPAPGNFLLCPAHWFSLGIPFQNGWQQSIYQQALAQAQAVTRPSLLERDLLGVWN